MTKIMSVSPSLELRQFGKGSNVLVLYLPPLSVCEKFAVELDQCLIVSQSDLRLESTARA